MNGYGEGDPEGFKAFFELYCPDALKGGKQGERPIRKVSVPRKWEPRAKEPSPALWREKAREFVEKRNAEMLRNAEGLALLERWGITAKTAETVMLGWNPKDAFYPVTKWGLPYAENDKGRERCVWIPAGLVIPCFQRDAAGKSVLKRIKVRVSDPELAKTRKYVHVTGGEPCYGVWGRPEWRIWVVVETERDAVLLWQELGKYGIGAMGTGSASNQPDPYACFPAPTAWSTRWTTMPQDVRRRTSGKRTPAFHGRNSHSPSAGWFPASLGRMWATCRVRASTSRAGFSTGCR